MKNPGPKGRREVPAENRKTAVKKPLASREVTDQKTAHPVSESDVLEKITEWAGDRREAERWYYEVTIPAFGMTAEQVYTAGMVKSLVEYIEGLRAGEFA